MISELICIHDNPDFAVPIEYTFDVLLSSCNVRHRILSLDRFEPDGLDPADSLIISYSDRPVNCGNLCQIHIGRSEFFGDRYLKPDSLPGTPLDSFEDLPVIYRAKPQTEGYVFRSQNLIHSNIDIIASSFFMITGYEEFIESARDDRGRFPARVSLAYREGFLDKPVVNGYIRMLNEWIREFIPESTSKTNWPGSADFALCLSHDIDSTQRYSWLPPVFAMINALTQFRPDRALRLLVDYCAAKTRLKKDPYDTFDYLLTGEKDLGIHSSYFFLSSAATYRITDTGIKRLVQKIADAGHEIGLHGGYNSFNDLRALSEEKRLLDDVVDEPVEGCRQHNLRWNNPETWRVQEQLGFRYDTSLGFADHAGFRNGICIPFQPFDILQNRKFNIWELPLVIMEGSLRSPAYQDMSSDEALAYIQGIVEQVARYNGVLTLLWHNSSFDELGDWKGWKEVYEEVLRYIANRNPWYATGKDVINHISEGRTQA